MTPLISILKDGDVWVLACVMTRRVATVETVAKARIGTQLEMGIGMRPVVVIVIAAIWKAPQPNLGLGSENDQNGDQ